MRIYDFRQIEIVFPMASQNLIPPKPHNLRIVDKLLGTSRRARKKETAKLMSLGE